jgi:predicted DCC family thiol-disulfide oxidoreductase YuxK
MNAISPLPTPIDRPHADIVIYDGHCRICTAQVERLARWDTHGRMSYLSLHDPEVRERFPDLSHDYLLTNMVVVDGQGNYHSGADGFRHLAKCLPWLWWLAVLMHIPFTMPIWRWGYRQFAKRRYLIGGKVDCDDGACAVHFPE